MVENRKAVTPQTKSRLRQCVGCRQEDEQTALLRFVRIPSEDGKKLLTFDALGKLPGRGCYLHLSPGCVKQALRGGFMRAFKGDIEPLGREDLLESLKIGIRRRIDAIIRAGFKCSDAFVGESAVANGMKENRITLLLIAIDSGDATQQKYSRNAERKKIAICNSFATCEAFGKWIGKPSVSLMGFGGGIAKKLQGELSNFDQLENFET